MQDVEFDGRLRSQGADLLGEIARILDRLAVHRGDNVTRLDAGFHRWAVLLRLGNKSALRFLEAQAIGDVWRYWLDLHADPAARDRAVLPELGDDAVDGVGRDREGDANRTAGR